MLPVNTKARPSASYGSRPDSQDTAVHTTPPRSTARSALASEFSSTQGSPEAGVADAVPVSPASAEAVSAGDAAEDARVLARTQARLLALSQRHV